MRRTILLFLLGAATLIGIGQAPASAATNQQGLVNVNITDVTVQVPVAVAANVCDVTVAVLVSAVNEAPTSCQSGSIALASNPNNHGNDNANQNGLVNVNLTDVTAQVPIGIAANICDVTAGVLTQNLNGAFTDCDSGVMSIARA